MENLPSSFKIIVLQHFLPSSAEVFSKLENICLKRIMMRTWLWFLPLEFLEAKHLGPDRVVLPSEQVDGGEDTEARRISS